MQRGAPAPLDRVCALCSHRSAAVVLAAHRVLGVLAASGSDLHLLFVTSALKAKPLSNALSTHIVSIFSAFYEALAICFAPASADATTTTKAAVQVRPASVVL